MNKLAILLATTAMLGGNCVYAEAETALASSMKKKKEQKEQPCPKKECGWGVGLVGLAIVGVVTGFTAAMASGSTN